MDSGSPSRKHPRSDAFASAAASLAPPNKRQRTTVLCNPVPQNLLNGASPYAKYNRNAGSQTPAGTSSPSGLASAKQSDTHSVTSSTGRSRLAEQVRSFAPKPLMSPFAARAALKNKSFGASTLRRTTSVASPSGRASNGSYSHPSSRAGSIVSAMSPPAPRSMSMIGSGLFTPAKPVATPTRRIHHPDFSFDNKPSPSSFRFTANDSHTNTPTAQSPGIASRAHTPVRREPTRGSPNLSFSPRASPAAPRASPTENKARADSILGLLNSSLDKAKQALAGNRADRLEEKRQREKEAIRRQMEEDERIRRAEIFERELEREEKEMQEEMERIEERKRMKEQEEIEKRQENEERAAEAQFISSVKHRSQEVQLGFGGANGGPSFVTEDTIPDTIYTDYNTQGSHYGVTSTFRDGHPAHDPSQELFSHPGEPLGATIDGSSDKMPQYPQLQRGLALHMERGKDREEDNTWEPGAKIPQQPQDNVISLDSDDDDDDDDSSSEQETLRRPSFLFPRVATQKDALSDDGSSQEPDGGEYYENEEYEEEDDSRNYEEGEGEYEEEFEEDAEAEEAYEEEEVSTMPRSYAIEDDDIEGAVDEFGSEPAEGSEGSSEAEMDQSGTKAEGEYEEEETEKDDTDTERIVEWKISKASKDEDPDRSLGSTVLLPSQPTSFTNKRPVSPDNFPSDLERTPVPEDRSHLSEPSRRPSPVQSTLGNNLFDARQPIEAQTIPAKAQASSSAPASPVTENNVGSGDELQTAEMDDSERPPSSSDSIIDHSINGDPDLEMQQAPTPTSDDRSPSPMAVDEEPKERGESLDAAEGARSDGEAKGSEVTEELDELPEASDLVIIEDDEDEESRDGPPTLYPMLPDSVYDRSSIAGEFAREATVETVEWDGNTYALSEGVRIVLEGVVGSSESGGEPLQPEEPVESDEEVELAEDLDEVEVEEKEVEGVVVGAESDSGESDSGRENQFARESAGEGEPGPVEEGAEVVEQTKEANLHEVAKSATLGIDPADRVETEECQAEELEAGVQADVEDAIDSEADASDISEEERVALVGFGHQYNGANSAQESEEKQQNQTSGIEVVVEIDRARQITPVSENPATPPQSEVAPAKHQRADAKLDHRPLGSPLSADSPVQQGLKSVGDDIQNEDAGEAPAPSKKKRIRKNRSKKRRRGSGVDPLHELRDGKAIQPPPSTVTPPKRTRRGQSAEPEALSRANSEEPGVRALRSRNVVVNRYLI